MFVVYYIVRLIFRLAAFFFFHSVQVVGLEYFPKSGPTIVVFNHGNSLTDAQLAVASTPRVVRLCAKDTLWKSWFWRIWMESAAGIPIRRRVDYGGSEQENTAAFEALYASLRHGGCVGLFPEGISRYHPELAPLKTGVARIALDFISQANGVPLSVQIVPVGITYLRRDKWRSDVLIRYSEPILVSRDTYNIADKDRSFASAKALTKQIEDAIKTKFLHGPDWQSIRLAHTLRRVYKPLGTQISLSDHVDLTKAFVEVLRTADTDPNVKSLCSHAKRYQDLLDSYVIRDADVRRNLPFLSLMWRIPLRALSCSLLFLLSCPGLFFLLPILAFSKYKESEVMKRKGGREMNLDEVAHFKSITALVLLPTLTTCSALVTWFLQGSTSCILSVFLVPLLCWMSTRWLEDSMHSLRMLNVHWRWLVLPRDVRATFVRLRRELEQETCRVAAGVNIDQMVLSTIQHSPLDYFSIVRRRKKSYSEIMRPIPVPDVDGEDVQ